MPTSAQKKPANKPSTETTAPQAPVAVPQVPALIAYYAVPAPKGQQSVLTPIGGAVAHPDGEGFTLHLNLIPANGAPIILRMPKAKQAA